MEQYKYMIKALFILGPGLLVIWILGGTYIHVAAWLGAMCYIELLEIQDKLKK